MTVALLLFANYVGFYPLEVNGKRVLTIGIFFHQGLGIKNRLHVQQRQFPEVRNGASQVIIRWSL